MNDKKLTPAQADRFWSKVEIGSPDVCWQWLASTNGVKGYGQLVVDYQRCYAHRVAYAQTYGPIPDGQFVCHRCDNPLCCNPSHLFLGTHTENMNDAKQKGRLRSRLTQDDAGALRQLYATGQFTLKQLAVKYGIDESSVSLIVNNKRWR